MRPLRYVATVLLAALVAVAPVSAHAGIDAATNAFREANGLPSLPTSSPLTALAAIRAEQIVNNFNHVDMGWMFARLPSCVTGLGENIAARTDDNTSDDASQVVQQWIGSTTHRQNMLGHWSRQGSAMIHVNGRTHAVQLFTLGCGSASAPAPTKPSVVAPAPRPATEQGLPPTMSNTSISPRP